MQPITITTLDDLNSLVEQLTDNIAELELQNINLSSLYSNIELKLTDSTGNLDGQLSSTLCRGLAEFHQELIKAYCIVKYNTDNLSKLKAEEKAQLEVVFTVKAGCTDIVGDLTNLLNALKGALSKVTDGMTGNQKIALLVLTISGVLGYNAFSDFSTYKTTELAATKEIKMAELNTAQSNQVISALVDVIKDNSHAMDKNEKVANQINKGYQGLIKTSLAVGAENIEFKGATVASLTKASAERMISSNQPSLTNQEDRLLLEIASIKRTGNSLSVSVHVQGSDSTFPLAVSTEFFGQEELNVLFDAFKNNESVYVDGAFKIRAGVIEKGVASAIISNSVV